MAERSEVVKDKGNILNNVVNKDEESITSDKRIDKEKAFENVTREENTFEPSGKNIDLNGSRDVDDYKTIDEDASLTWSLSLGNDAVIGDLDDVWVNEASEKGNVTDDTDDEGSEYDTTLENKSEDSDDDVDVVYSTEDDTCIDISDELTNTIDLLNVECEASNKNVRTADPAEDAKKDGPTTTETPPVKFARIVFDATDMNKGCKTMRLKAATSMREIKKLFPKHLSATEDTFMLYFNNREVENETPLQLFGKNLEGDNNVIEIVKSIKIRLGGHDFPEKGRYLDEKPNTPFSEIRQKIAVYLKEPQALIGLVYNNKEIVTGETPESVQMVHGDVLKVIMKDKMKIRFRGSVFNMNIDIDPNITTMRKLKSVISHYVKKDQRKIMLMYGGRIPNDQDTPVTLGMSDTDILSANLKFGVIIKITGPMSDMEEFYLAEKPLKGLFQTYSEMHQLVNSTDKRAKSFVFRFNGTVIDDEDTPKSLDMVDGDCITVSEELTQVFSGSVLIRGFELLRIDSEMKFKDVRKHFSDQIGVDFKNLVLTVGGERVGDDDTLQSLKICNGASVISVSVEEYIEVHVLYFCLGQELQTRTSKMRPGMAMEEWKSEISAELGEPVHYLSFMWEDSQIADVDTPERIGIQNGDTVKVHSSSVIEIHIETDGQVLMDYLIHVDQDFFALAKWYSREFHVGVNSILFKFGERVVHLLSDTASKIGLEEDGTIHVFLPRQENVMTVEFYVENSSLLSIFPRLNEFPLLWDASTVDQVFLLKYLFEDLFIEEIDPSCIRFLFNEKEIDNDKTLQEIGVSKDCKIFIDVREDNRDEKEVTVYVRRNMKETKSSMGNGQQCDDVEMCAFKLDSSKPLSEFIKKVKSRITCKSKKDKLFLSFNDAMVNKDDLGKNLKLDTFTNCFKCYAFPNLEAFKKHLETFPSENVSSMGSYGDSDDSFSSGDLDFLMPNYKRSNEKQNQGESISSEDFDLPITPPNYKHKHGDEQSSDERTKDIKKKLKAIQMRINIEKKKDKTGSISLAKDIQNHKDFENVDDILKFIGEEDLTSKTSKENKDQVGSFKRRKHKNKRIKTPSTCKESDKKVEMQDSNRDDSVVEVSIDQEDIKDNKKNEILDGLNEDKKDPGNEQSNNGKNKTDFDGDGCKNTENGKAFEKQINKNKQETNCKESDKKVKSVKDSKMDVFQDLVQRSKGNVKGEQNEIKDVTKKGKKQKRKNQSNKSKDKTNLCGIVCKVCTFNNNRDAIFCEVCGDDLSIDEQNWQKVGIENKRKLSTKIQSKEKNNFLKSKTSTFVHPEKLLQNSVPKRTPYSHHEKLLQESDLRTKGTCNEENLSESVHPKQQVSTFRRKDPKLRKGDMVPTKLKQVEAKTEICLENEKAIAFPKIKETCILNKFTSKGNESRKDINNRKKWTASEKYDYRQPVTEKDKIIPEENKNSKPDDQGIPVLTEDEEETRKWCQLMVAARKRKDEERKRDYLKFLDMQSRNISPQLDETHHGRNADVSSGTKPVVPQPRGTVKYYSGNTQLGSIPMEGRQFGPSFEANHRPNPAVFQWWI